MPLSFDPEAPNLQENYFKLQSKSLFFKKRKGDVMDNSEAFIQKIVVEKLDLKTIKKLKANGYIVFRQRKKRNRKRKFSLYPGSKNKKRKRSKKKRHTLGIYYYVIYPGVCVSLDKKIERFEHFLLNSSKINCREKSTNFSALKKQSLNKSNNTHFGIASQCLPKCEVNAKHSHGGFSSSTVLRKNKVPLDKKSKLPLSKKFNMPLESNPYHEKILQQILSIGYPFIKHRKNSMEYKQSLAFVEKYFKKYRNEIVDIFKLAKEYFTNPDFVYHPKKISIRSFFKYSQEELQRMPHLGKYNVKSWFKEFSKGKDHIEENFMKVKTDKYPELTKIMIEHWKRFKQQDKISAYEKRCFVIFTAKINNYAKMNKLSVRTIFETINNFMFKAENPFMLNNPMFFNGEYFWTMVLPKMLLSAKILQKKRRN